jgi:hypothetical protein
MVFRSRVTHTSCFEVSTRGGVGASRSMIGRGALLMPALSVVMTALDACNGGSTDAQAGSTTPIAEKTKVSATVARPDKLTGEAPADREVYEFTASGRRVSNVGCCLDVDYVRCDIAEADWLPLPRPADCEFDYGKGITLAPGGSSEFVCAGDTALVPDGSALPPTASRSPPRRCNATCAESGITCRDVETGQGFSISREAYQLF